MWDFSKGLLAKASFCSGVADVNCDTFIDAVDARLIEYAASGIEPLDRAEIGDGCADPTPVPTPLPGDVDGDGLVTLKDADRVQSVLSGELPLSAISAERADVNCSQEVTDVDVALIRDAADGLRNLDPQLGDVNADGILDESDTDLIALYYVDLEIPGATNRCVADADCNGSIDIVDALIVGQASEGIRSTPLYCPQLGDADGDGKVSDADALLVTAFASGNHSMITQFVIESSMDANCDGNIDATDASLVSDAAVGLFELHCWRLGDINVDGELNFEDFVISELLAGGNAGLVRTRLVESLADLDCNGWTDADDTELQREARNQGVWPTDCRMVAESAPTETQ